MKAEACASARGVGTAQSATIAVSRNEGGGVRLRSAGISARRSQLSPRSRNEGGGVRLRSELALVGPAETLDEMPQ